MKPHLSLVFMVLCAAGLALAQSQRPIVEAGSMPRSWSIWGRNCSSEPKWEAQNYNSDFVIVRESGCTNYEKPFLYLIFGSEHALLVDTGAGKPDTDVEVAALMQQWSQAHGGKRVSLVVAHSHAHNDHIAGDEQFRSATGVRLVEPNVDSVKAAFAMEQWPEEPGAIDLGDRILDVIPIPGHERSSVAYYDRRTGILLTGDSLYPGRIYVSDWLAFKESLRRLLQFTASRPVTHILGCHIEQTSKPFVDYPIGTVKQEDEHALALGREELLELNEASAPLMKPERVYLRDFTIWPVTPKPPAKAKH